MKKRPNYTSLPGATFIGVSSESNEYVAWDGYQYVLRPSLANVLAYDNLIPIGSVKELAVDDGWVGTGGQVGVVRMGTPKMGHARGCPNRPAAMPQPQREKKPTFSDALLLKYRSETKRAILLQLTKNPRARDLDVCRDLDDDGSAELPKPWESQPGNRSFADAYKDPGRRHRIEIVISNVRADLRQRKLLQGR